MRTLMAVVLVLLLCACPAVTGIGPEGGTIASDDGRLTLVIPPRALLEVTPIRVTAVEVPEGSGFEPKTLYRFEPDKLHFASPATLTLSMEGLSSPEQLRLAREEDGDVAEVESFVTVDLERQRLVAELSGFSTHGMTRCERGYCLEATASQSPRAAVVRWSSSGRRAVLERAVCPAPCALNPAQLTNPPASVIFSTWTSEAGRFEDPVGPESTVRWYRVMRDGVERSRTFVFFAGMEQAPPSPGRFSVQRTADGNVEASWQAIDDDFVTYELERSACGVVENFAIGPRQSSFVDRLTWYGVATRWRLRAVRAAGVSEWVTDTTRPLVPPGGCSVALERCELEAAPGALLTVGLQRQATTAVTVAAPSALHATVGPAMLSLTSGSAGTFQGAVLGESPAGQCSAPFTVRVVGAETLVNLHVLSDNGEPFSPVWVAVRSTGEGWRRPAGTGPFTFDVFSTGERAYEAVVVCHSTGRDTTIRLLQATLDDTTQPVISCARPASVSFGGLWAGLTVGCMRASMGRSGFADCTNNVVPFAGLVPSGSSDLLLGHRASTTADVDAVKAVRGFVVNGAVANAMVEVADATPTQTQALLSTDPFDSAEVTWRTSAGRLLLGTARNRTSATIPFVPPAVLADADRQVVTIRRGTNSWTRFLRTPADVQFPPTQQQPLTATFSRGPLPTFSVTSAADGDFDHYSVVSIDDGMVGQYQTWEAFVTRRARLLRSGNWVSPDYGTAPGVQLAWLPAQLRLTSWRVVRSSFGGAPIDDTRKLAVVMERADQAAHGVELWQITAP